MLRLGKSLFFIPEKKKGGNRIKQRKCQQAGTPCKPFKSHLLQVRDFLFLLIFPDSGFNS